MPSSPFVPWISGKTTSTRRRLDSACVAVEDAVAEGLVEALEALGADAVERLLGLRGCQPGALAGDADGHGLEAVVVDRGHDALRGDHGDLVLGGLAAEEHADLQLLAARAHRNSPAIWTSVSSSMPKCSLMRSRARSISEVTSFAVAPPWFSMKLVCFSEIWASPIGWPRRPTWSTYHQEPCSVPGFLKTEPQFWPGGWAALRCVSNSLTRAVRATGSPRRDSEVDAEDDAVRQLASGEGAVSVREAEVFGRQLDDLAGGVGHANAPEDVGERRAVGAGVGDDGAAEAAGDAAGPFEAGVSVDGHAARERCEADAAAGVDLESGAVLHRPVDRVGAVLDGEAADAAVADEDVRA